MTQPLRDFISSIRLADSIEQEKFLIATEQAQIRAYIKKIDPDYRPRIVAKLVFLEMIGQNPAWGQMEAITLMTNERFSYKRIGYICTSVLLDQTNDLSVLVTQTLLRDLTNTDMNIVNLALAFIANLGSPEIGRAVASEVQKHLNSKVSSVQKRAGMATVRIIRSNPDLSDSYKNSVQPLLNSSNHGVVIAGINLVIAMIEIEPKLIKAWAQFSGPFTKILKSLVNSRATREFAYGVFNDPYMQVKSMKALGLLQNRSDELDGLLQSIISSTVPKKNTGRTILYQAVECIVSVSTKSSLRALAFNQIGRMLSMRDPNVLYSALSVFARVLYAEKVIIDRTSVDAMALQRYKKSIVKCLDHKDPSIRRRALDVISALIDEKNAETLIPEILVYMKMADSDFRAELVNKIYSSTQRFAPNKIWIFDTVHQILIDNGNYVSLEIITSFCDFISNTTEIQLHAVEKLSESLVNFSDNQSLIQVAAFIIGEFATQDNGQTQSLKHILLMPQTNVDTKMYIIMALAKMAARFGGSEDTIEVLRKQSESNNLEVQQRSGEMMKLLTHRDVCDEMLAPIAASLVEKEQNPIQIIDGSTPGQQSQQSLQNQQNLINQAQQAQKNTDQDDLLLFVLNDTELNNNNTINNTNQINNNNSNAQDDLLSLVEDMPSQPSQQIQQPNQQQQKKSQVTELLRSSELIVYGQAKANPKDKRQIALNLIYYSASSQLTDFKVNIQLPPGWQVNQQQPDGNVLNPVGEKPVSQVLYLLNMNNSPFQMQLKVQYKYGTQPLSEVGVIRALPPVQ
ncbi:AP-1 complex subunit gamma-1 [Tritrichomonas musculus]|uniref:AP-1 complex subunit gamma n=1 Tax=Tritrichomonas musculus TaxID=1915356 RepID=A0ABR2JV46_9EUKA